MSERWIKECEQVLEGMRKVTSKKDRDRLEHITAMLFIINALERSLNGWKMWVRNLSMMSRFTLEELEEIEKALHKQAESIIKYDIEATKKWKGKFPVLRIPRQRRVRREDTPGLIV